MINKIAVVTGGSKGIGSEICKKLAKNGYFTIICFSSNEAKAKKVLEEINSFDGKGEILGFDVSNPLEVSERFELIRDKYGPVFVLVNNAGITIDSLLLRLKESDINKTLDIDLKGAIYCTREAAKQMVTKRCGSIIQISSVVAQAGSPGQGVYAAAKAGLIGFSKSIAKELAKRNIRVNVVAPGFITTDMTDKLNENLKKEYLKNIPLGTFGSTEDIASLVEFLASDSSKYITGQVIGINGGLYM